MSLCLCTASGELPELHGIKHRLDVINDAGEVFQYGSLKKRAENQVSPEAFILQANTSFSSPASQQGRHTYFTLGKTFQYLLHDSATHLHCSGTEKNKGCKLKQRCRGSFTPGINISPEGPVTGDHITWPLGMGVRIPRVVLLSKQQNLFWVFFVFLFYHNTTIFAI